MEQELSVAGGAARDHVQLHAAAAKRVARGQKRVPRDIEGLSVVAGVEAVNERAVIVHERELGGGASGVDAQVAAQRAPSLARLRRHVVRIGQRRQRAAREEALALRVRGE